MDDFSNPDHMPRFLDEVLANASADIRAMCGDNAECIFDAVETGDTNIGLETLGTNQENNDNQMIACKFNKTVYILGSRHNFRDKRCLLYLYRYV